MGNTFDKKGNACLFSKPIPATQQTPGKGLDPRGILRTPRCNAPGRESSEAVSLLHTAGLRPGVAVTIPGSHRAPWSEPSSDIRSGVCSALLLPFWLLHTGLALASSHSEPGLLKSRSTPGPGIVSSHLLCCPAWYSRKTSHVYLQSSGAGIGSFVTWSRAGLWKLNSQGQDGN